jgi:3-oxoacyl-[acyl-carrier protein] reductase
MSELANKTVIITGASRGIGACAARAFASKGANVILAARSRTAIENIAQEIENAGGKATSVPCDVSRYADVAHLVSTAESLYGPVDVLVNNAGVIDPIARMADSDPHAWDEVVDINFKGVYHGMRAVLPSMAERATGVVLNISSGAAVSAMEGWSHYCSTKAAVLSLTRCAHMEYAEQGVRVLGLSPGTVATEMQILIKASGINPVSQLDPAVHISPERVATAICWLCTSDASDIAGEDYSLKDTASRARAGIAD